MKKVQNVRTKSAFTPKNYLKKKKTKRSAQEALFLYLNRIY